MRTFDPMNENVLAKLKILAESAKYDVSCSSSGTVRRNQAGTLVEVGRGKLTLDGFRQVIEKKDRCSAGNSVPGHALFLVDVGYPEELFI